VVAPQYPIQATVNVGQMGGTTPANNVQWSIQPGMVVYVDSGANQEAVIVQSVAPNSFTALFNQPHAPGAAVTIPGNPGPISSNFDYTQPPIQAIVRFVNIYY
jgi:hypothetical protein